MVNDSFPQQKRLLLMKYHGFFEYVLKKIVELKKDNETLKYTFEYSYQNHKLYEEKDNTIYYIMNNKYIAFVKGE